MGIWYKLKIFSGELFAIFWITILLGVGLFRNDDNIALYGTAFATVILGLATYNMVGEMRKSRIEQSRPYIFVDFDISYGEQLIHILVKNIGGAAKNVKFKFDPELIDSRGRNVSNAIIFKNGINFFPPNKEIKQFFDTTIAYFGSDKPMIFNLGVSYSDFKTEKETEKPQFEETFILDLSTFGNLQYVERKGLHEIAKSTEKLAEELNDLRLLFKDQIDTNPKMIKHRFSQVPKSS